MHHIFEVGNERGLSTLLQEPSLTGEALRGMVHETSIPNLYVLRRVPRRQRGCCTRPCCRSY